MIDKCSICRSDLRYHSNLYPVNPLSPTAIVCSSTDHFRIRCQLTGGIKTRGEIVTDIVISIKDFATFYFIPSRMELIVYFVEGSLESIHQRLQIDSIDDLIAHINNFTESRVFL
jgi:hypothetical protein